MPLITGVPIIITSPGVYTLQSDLTFNGTTGQAILIQANNVTIDLNGHSITNIGGTPDQTAYGVLATNCTNITITNGTIDGFYWGVRLSDATTGTETYGNHHITDLNVLNSTFRGIVVEGPNNVVENNIVNGVQGTTVFPNAFAAGIESSGPGATITNNKVNEIYATGSGEALGISISNNGVGTIVSGNIVTNIIYDDFRSFGLWVGGGSDVTAFGNTFNTFTHGTAWSSVTYGSFYNNTFVNEIIQYIVSTTNVMDNGNTFFFPARNNTFEAQGGNDVLYGNSRIDHLSGGDGDDQLYASAGADILDGGNGFDTLRFDNANYVGFTISLSNPAINTGIAAGQTYNNFERLILSSGSDKVYGDAVNNLIYGRDGNDLLFGNAGNDQLLGENGNDHLFGGFGADRLVGAAGFDYARYDDANYGDFTVSLANSAINTGVAAGDTFSGIEGLILSSGTDIAYGDISSNWIYGRAGNDLLFGNAGNDQLFGENGNDHLFGGLGADRLDGATGFDYVRYDDANYAGFTVSLANPAINTGVAAGDTFAGIDGLILSSSTDRAYGDGAGNWIYGRNGDDTIYGLDGADTIFGEESNDALFGGNHNDNILGGSGNDLISGDVGDDILNGDSGADRIYGGAGLDQFVFTPGCGIDRVFDFQNDLDKIAISTSFGFSDAAEVISATSIVGNTIWFNLDPVVGDYFQLVGWLANGATLAQLQNDILFV